MSTTKAVREAKARLAALEAQRAALEVQIAEATKGRQPFEARVAAIKRRRYRTKVIKNLAGTYYVGALDDLNAKTNYAKELKPTPKAVREALEAGTVKVDGGGYGQEYSLKGLLPRLRVLDKPTFRLYQRAVAARNRAEMALSKAKNTEAAAFAAAYNAGAKPDQETVIAGIVDAAVAEMKLRAQPIPHQLKHDLTRLAEWSESPIPQAIAHLKHAQSGSAEPCPCRTCAADRQQAIKERDEAARRATLPSRMVKCPDHGRRRMHWEVRSMWWGNLSDEIQAKLPDELRGRQVDLPVAYCPKGEGRVLLTEYLAEREKAAKIAARKAGKSKAAKGPDEGDAVTFTCPSCGEVTTSEVYLGEDGETLVVGCDNCQAEPLAGAVVIHRERKAA